MRIYRNVIAIAVVSTLGASLLWRVEATPPPKNAALLSKAKAIGRTIDARIDGAIANAGLQPAPLAEKEAIIRRLSLDLTGRIPHSTTIVNYLKSRKEDKYDDLVSSFLNSPEFNEHWANSLASAWIGRKIRRNSNYFKMWLREQLDKRRPYDAIVRDVIAAEGTVDDNGASYFTLRWDTQPTNVAAQSARVFMGLQIQCAQCHDHPFTEWKQEQFHEFAAFFAGMRRTNKRVKEQRIPGVGQRKKNEYKYKLKDSKEDRIFQPKFLFDFDLDDEDVDAPNPRREVAILMTHPENPYFAKMTVNRVWKILFGRGLVEPVEDLEANPGYHPILLNSLAAEFVNTGFDIRQLIRSIVHSRVYQRSSVRPRTQKDPAAEYEKVKDSKNEEKREAAATKAQQEVWLFARASLRPLTPEQIAASMFRALVIPPEEAEAYGKQWSEKYKQRVENQKRNLVRQFDQLFGENEQTNPDAFDGTIPQSLIMLNGAFVNQAIKPTKGTIMAKILNEKMSPKDTVTTIFMSVLSRRPSKAESRAFTRYIKSQGAKPETYADLMWALINSSEFLMNH